MSAQRESASARLTAGTDRTTGIAYALAVTGGIATASAQTPGPLMGGLLFLAAASALMPLTGLLVLAATLPFYLYQKSLGAMLFSVPELVLLSTLAGAGIHAAWQLRGGERARGADLATSLDAPIGLFLAAALASLAASEVLRVSLRDLRTLILEPVAAVYLVSWFVRPAQTRWMVVALVSGGTAAASLGFAQYLFTGHSVSVEGTVRMLGPYPSPNQLALYLGRTLPLALGVALFVPGFRVLAGAATALVLVAAGLTFSVGGWLAMALAVAAVVLLWRPKALAAMAAVTVAAAVIAYPILTTERFASHLSPFSGTSFIRVQLWESSIRMILDHPILGVGMDNFLYQYRSAYLLPGAVADPNLSHPHNLILNFWLQIGIFGLLAFAWIVIVLFRSWLSVWRGVKSPWHRAIAAGIAGVAVDFFVHGLVDNSYFLTDLAYHFWLLAGVTIVMTRGSALSRSQAK